MARKSRGHRPPQQSAAGRVPVIDPNRQQQAQAQAEAAIRQRVEGVAATIYTENVDIDIECSDEEWAERCEAISDRAIDAALVLGKNLWGIQAQRQKPAKKPKRAPRVITEDDDE